MNNRWSIYLSKIFGYFWDRVFKDQQFLSGVKKGLGYAAEDLCDTYDRSKSSRFIQDTQDMYVRMEYTTVPADDCIFNYCPITAYEDGDIIGKESTVRSVAIPIKYTHRCLTMQDSLTDPSHLWVTGFNMCHNDKYTILYLKPATELKQYPEIVDGSLVATFKLYKTYKLSYNAKNDTFGVLMNADVSNMQDSDIQSLWKVYTKGPVISEVAKLVASMTGSDVATSDGYVVDIWKELGKWCIMDSNSKIYTGCTPPAVKLQDEIHPGSILFEGMSVLDIFNTPSAEELPALFIPCPQGTIKAVNAVIPALTADINGQIKYIPDMGNPEWTAEVMQYLKDHPDVTLLTSPECNPLQYIIDNVCPGSISTFVVSGAVVKHPELSKAINSVVVSGKALPGLTISTLANTDERVGCIPIHAGSLVYGITVDSDTIKLHLVSGRVSVTVI